MRRSDRIGDRSETELSLKALQPGNSCSYRWQRRTTTLVSRSVLHTECQVHLSPRVLPSSTHYPHPSSSHLGLDDPLHRVLNLSLWLVFYQSTVKVTRTSALTSAMNEEDLHA
ncbi:hypothetical protein V1477_009217 [Vespula maculifrons]|uniref:Uncharacterized protein n=1 Tax=Vespula maculifrons TaxID=7453 RepID=A0ABD2CC30_VESMC